MLQARGVTMPRWLCVRHHELPCKTLFFRWVPCLQNAASEFRSSPNAVPGPRLRPSKTARKYPSEELNIHEGKRIGHEQSDAAPGRSIEVIYRAKPRPRCKVPADLGRGG